MNVQPLQPPGGGLRIRSLLKNGVAEGLHRAGLDRVVGRLRGRQFAPAIVGYHRVVEDFARSAAMTMPSMLVSTSTFTQQLEWLSRHYAFVSPDELLQLQQDDTQKTARPVALLTFDDGYDDVYRNALPVLQRMGIPAAMYVVSDLVGGQRLLAHDELYWFFARLLTGSVALAVSLPAEILASQLLPGSLKRRLVLALQRERTPHGMTRALLEALDPGQIQAFLRTLARRLCLPRCEQTDFRLLDWDMVRALQRHDITIGSHTCSHALLDRLDAASVRRELVQSRRVLEQQLGVEVRHLAYPDGRFDSIVLREAAAAGYHSAVTICGHRDPQHSNLTLPRSMLWEHSSMSDTGTFSAAIMSCQVNGIFDPADRCRDKH